MAFNLELDIRQLINLDEKLKDRAEKSLRQAASALAVMGRAHIAERVSKQLRSSKDAYIKNLKHKKLNNDTWLVELVYDPKDPDSKLAAMIERGATRWEMIDDLLKSPKAKTAKDGSKYLVVPFKQNKAPTRTPEAGLSLQDTVKNFLKSKGVAWGKIEKNADGSAKTGLLHSHDQNALPLKTHNGPYQGHGAIGNVRQGQTGIPFLRGIRVYQSLVKDDAGKPVMGNDGHQKAIRGIMTFRIVSSKMKGSGRWVHPGLKARAFFPEAFDWMKDLWETKISKQVIDEILAP